mmetsp:Transcript_1673/g.5049  ORF Transcript_1673/g.5049 Transcript_1673/m.5049 type:complete len:118 (-) Transcript_1673:938-1291(-)
MASSVEVKTHCVTTLLDHILNAQRTVTPPPPFHWEDRAYSFVNLMIFTSGKEAESATSTHLRPRSSKILCKSAISRGLRGTTDRKHSVFDELSRWKVSASGSQLALLYVRSVPMIKL